MFTIDAIDCLTDWLPWQRELTEMVRERVKKSKVSTYSTIVVIKSNQDKYRTYAKYIGKKINNRGWSMVNSFVTFTILHSVKMSSNLWIFYVKSFMEFWFQLCIMHKLKKNCHTSIFNHLNFRVNANASKNIWNFHCQNSPRALNLMCVLYGW